MPQSIVLHSVPSALPACLKCSAVMSLAFVDLDEDTAYYVCPFCRLGFDVPNHKYHQQLKSKEQRDDAVLSVF